MVAASIQHSRSDTNQTVCSLMALGVKTEILKPCAQCSPGISSVGGGSYRVIHKICGNTKNVINCVVEMLSLSSTRLQICLISWQILFWTTSIAQRFLFVL